MNLSRAALHGAAAPRRDAGDCLSLAYRRGNAKGPALLLLHGWGSNSAVWEDFSRALENTLEIFALDLPGHGVNAASRCQSAEEFRAMFLRDIEPQLPENYSICGWSLGGSLAALLAAASARVQRVITIASNPVFVAGKDWPEAMERASFDSFTSSLQQYPEKALQRFRSLQATGAPDARALLRQLQAVSGASAYSSEQLAVCLRWLAELDARASYHSIEVPVVHYLGACDALVPDAVRGELAREFPGHSLRRFAASGHLPFASESEYCRQCMLEDLGLGDASQAPASTKVLDKRAVAGAFSRASGSYEQHALLQKRIGEQLFSRLDFSRLENREAVRVLDLGSGTGHFASRFSKALSAADTVIALDLAMGMLQQCAVSEDRANDETKAGIARVRADFEHLPLAQSSFDIIFANFSLQWCEDFEHTLVELSRLLKPGGTLLLSTLARGSLQELRDAWSEVDSAPHVNRFAQTQQLKAAAAATGLKQRLCSVSTEQERFADAGALLQSVKGIGAGNHLKSRDRGLLGVRKYRRFLQALERSRDGSGALTLSYRVVQLQLQRETQ